MDAEYQNFGRGGQVEARIILHAKCGFPLWNVRAVPHRREAFGNGVILKITDLVTGLRVTEDQEVEGLDITQHGEEAYYLES
jgi:hypothetical protein